MKMNNDSIQAIPTHIITGFLGVGKTSTILNLLKHKPSGERWAVLVNEFGEIGVDGSIIEGQHSNTDGFFIREVPGGCMCCAAGLPMQVALNQLLTKARPNRLFIEPTGLGHPKEVLQVLSTEYYQNVLDLQKTITLVDARKLEDKRYTEHEIFNQQISIADTIVGNKMDLYRDNDRINLLDYVKRLTKSDTQIIFTQNGELSLTQLKGPNNNKAITPIHHHHHHKEKPLAADLPMPACGYIKAINHGEGFNSIGWRFSSKKIFSRNRLTEFLSSLKVERIKATFITDAGAFSYNQTKDNLSELVLNSCSESRIEVLFDSAEDEIETRLLSCIIGAQG